MLTFLLCPESQENILWKVWKRIQVGSAGGEAEEEANTKPPAEENIERKGNR